MTLFTANGVLVANTRLYMRGIGGQSSVYLPMSYQDWLRTQEMSFAESRKISRGYMKQCISWLSDVPELYCCKAPGMTCLSALRQQKREIKHYDTFIGKPQNDSKGCGGIMRVAPIALQNYAHLSIEQIDREGAEAATITHGHSLGYMPAAVLTHIIRSIVYQKNPRHLKRLFWKQRMPFLGCLLVIGIWKS